MTTCNILWCSCINPTISVYEQLHGKKFDWNAPPLAHLAHMLPFILLPSHTPHGGHVELMQVQKLLWCYNYHSIFLRTVDTLHQLTKRNTKHVSLPDDTTLPWLILKGELGAPYLVPTSTNPMALCVACLQLWLHIGTNGTIPRPLLHHCHKHPTREHHFCWHNHTLHPSLQTTPCCPQAQHRHYCQPSY